MAKAKTKIDQGVILTTRYGPVAAVKVLDKDYKRALEIGLAELIAIGEIVYNDIKA